MNRNDRLQPPVNVASELERALEPVIERILAKLLAQRDMKPDNDASNEYLSTEEAAAFARVSQGTIRKWVRKGELTRHEAGSRVRVKRDELERYMRCKVVPIDINLTPEERARRRFG